MSSQEPPRLTGWWIHLRITNMQTSPFREARRRRMVTMMESCLLYAFEKGETSEAPSVGAVAAPTETTEIERGRNSSVRRWPLLLKEPYILFSASLGFFTFFILSTSFFIHDLRVAAAVARAILFCPIFLWHFHSFALVVNLHSFYLLKRSRTTPTHSPHLHFQL